MENFLCFIFGHDWHVEDRERFTDFYVKTCWNCDAIVAIDYCKESDFKDTQPVEENATT